MKVKLDDIIDALEFVNDGMDTTAYLNPENLKIVYIDDYIDISEEEKENSVLLQNTGRYALSERWKTLRHIHELLICDKVIFPYWENTAKIISFDTAIILLFQIILLIYPIIYGIFLLSKTYLFLNKMLHQKRLAWKNRYRSEIKQI